MGLARLAGWSLPRLSRRPLRGNAGAPGLRQRRLALARALRWHGRRLPSVLGGGLPASLAATLLLQLAGLVALSLLTLAGPALGLAVGGGLLFSLPSAKLPFGLLAILHAALASLLCLLVLPRPSLCLGLVLLCQTRQLGLMRRGHSLGLPLRFLCLRLSVSESLPEPLKLASGVFQLGQRRFVREHQLLLLVALQCG